MTEPFVIVSTGAERRLARIRDLQEVVPLLALSPVARASGSCRGVASLRGAIMPVFDLGGADTRLTPSRSILVYRLEEGLIGLIVDDTHDVVAIPREALSVRAVGPGRVISLARLGDAWLSVIDPQEFLGAHALA